jgi:hypothetical protein
MRKSLLPLVNNPKAASSIHDFDQRLEDWATNCRVMIENGGVVPADEARRLALIDMLPPELSSEATMKMDNPEFDSFVKIKKWAVKYCKVLKEKTKKRTGAVQVVDQDGGSSTGASENGEDIEDEWETQEAQIKATMVENGADAATQDLVLAVMRGRFQQKRFAGRPGIQRGPRGERPGPPPRGVQDMSCANCGKKGHTAAVCRGPKLDAKDRPCFGCGEPGHKSADCPKKGQPRTSAKPVKSVESQKILCIDCPPPPIADSDGFRRSRREVKLQLKDFLKPMPSNKVRSGVRFRPLQDDDLCEDGCNCHASCDAEETSSSPLAPILKKTLDMRSALVGRDAKAKLAAIIADDDYDEVLRRMWSKHLLTLPKSNKHVPNWGSPAWSMWFDKVDLNKDDGKPAVRYGGDAGEDMEGPDDGGCRYEDWEMQIDEKVDRALELPTGMSNVGRPPIADEDRPVRRWDNQRRHARGAGPESKHCQSVGCVPFGQGDNVIDANERLADLIYAVSKSEEEGNRAVLKAVASVVGITSDDEIEGLLKGRSERRIAAPSHVRHLLKNMNLGHVLEPVNLLVGADGPILAAEEQQWRDIEFEVALDSGSVVHVAAEGDTPMYVLDNSASARECANFIVGDGGTMENKGQKRLNLSCGDSDFASVFQIAAVHRPLMSVGKICDNDNEVRFTKTRAVVLDSRGAEICVFTRQPGGLYTAKLKLRSPFGRQE